MILWFTVLMIVKFIQVDKLRDCIQNGELVPKDIVLRYVDTQIAENMGKDGIILDGFPRDMTQVSEFEVKVNQYLRIRCTTYIKLRFYSITVFL